MKTTNEIRAAFLDFFRNKGHEVVASSSLVPGNDPTLLFTNAGMVQFKEVFLGQEDPGYRRATSSQRCVRAGGKHNDLENVGYTARHHTFFEMLGNFSFGDYFKREAIEFAWEFLTKELGLPEEKLWITVYQDDQEAEDIWLKELGVSAERFSRCGEKDNFWSMGDTGPCGPCSEIFYDHGEDIAGGPPGSPDEDGDRYIEIWNLVFTQYDRDKSGELKPIPKPSVDTGMGLERIAAVLQSVHNNYEIDLFANLIKAIYDLAHEHQINTDGMDMMSTRVVADHIRSCAFMIADGVVPANEGRGYVLRRIIRRAIRHGNKLGFQKPFFHLLVAALDAEMGEAFPEFRQRRADVEKILLQEEQRFAETLEQGLKLLEQVIAGMQGKVIPGVEVFRLYDTYGFPYDLTADIARERGLSLDTRGYETAMAEQKAKARASSKFEMDASLFPTIDEETDFSGYTELKSSSTVVALLQDGRFVNALNKGASGGIVLDATPFYAESGGQVGDAGYISNDDSRFQVSDTQKQGKAHIHLGQVSSGQLNVGDKVDTHVDENRRSDIVRNHSATHLLHAALRQILGEHVTQKGSLVAADRLRFDFSHNEAISRQQLLEIEHLVNGIILQNEASMIRVMPLSEAKQSGAMSLFGEKYEDEVRVLNIGGTFSIELCGGTHVSQSGEIGLMKIINETGIAAGVRRIEAVTGRGAFQWIEQNENTLLEAATLLKSDRDSLVKKLNQQIDKTRQLDKELTQLKSKLASHAGDDLASEAVEIQGVKVIARALDNVDPKSLRDTVDQLKNKLGSAALVLATTGEGRVSLVAGVTRDFTDRINAGKLVNFVAARVGGKGGGRPDMAQAGGNNPEDLSAALADVPGWIAEQLE